jgi:hypothetical protein
MIKVIIHCGSAVIDQQSGQKQSLVGQIRVVRLPFALRYGMSAHTYVERKPAGENPR